MRNLSRVGLCSLDRGLPIDDECGQSDGFQLLARTVTDLEGWKGGQAASAAKGSTREKHERYNTVYLSRLDVGVETILYQDLYGLNGCDLVATSKAVCCRGEPQSRSFSSYSKLQR